GKDFPEYSALYEWSVAEPEAFWAALWDYLDILCETQYTAVVDDLKKFPGAQWFVGARLNFAENMLRHMHGTEEAVVFRGEDQVRRTYTKDAFRVQVLRFAEALRADGVQPGDRVAGYLPNLPETIIAYFGAAAIGAVWCSCATDIGPAAAIDRLGQTEPTVLVTADGYFYKGKRFDVLGHAKEIAQGIPSVRRVVIAHYAGDSTDCAGIPDAARWEDYLGDRDISDFHFEPLGASHPLVIMFSSGTTGKPKCMVQSAAGLLLNQLKEVMLHSDIDERSTLLYITTCSWMMWNWQAAALGAGAKLVLYDGNPAYPDDAAIWKILEQEHVTVFGLSASYIHGLMAKGFSPRSNADLSALCSISQTGSALSDEGFAWVYREVKSDLHFNSIAGGTDINGCFAIGSPLCPVYAGELQARGLGMPVECFDDDGKPVRDVQGELVCRYPTPSMPLYFWNDADGKRYREAYFDVFPGIWRHGDYVQIHSDTGGVTFYGRSDAILKPSGVRIGTAEIYNQVDRVEGVADSLAIGQQYHGDQRVILFVQTKEGVTLDDAMKKAICTTLRVNASPRHVPALILPAPDLPRTLNGKKVESAVTNLLNHRAVTNRDALQNPESLDYFEEISRTLDA
ncbi:MAG: acetoacetate--CoA ligase, partial [Butyricicoccus sp.]